MIKSRLLPSALAVVAASLVAVPCTHCPAQAEKEKTALTDIKIEKDKSARAAAPLASVYGLVKAMSMLSKKLKTDWTADNPVQQQAINLQKQLEGELADVPKEMVDGLASENLDELNKFLQDRGYSIKLRPMSPGDVGVVCSTELEGKWQGTDAGKVKFANGNKYPSFILKQAEFHTVGDHPFPVIRVYFDEKRDVAIYVTPYEDELPGLDAAGTAARLTPKSAPNEQKWNQVSLPMVDKNVSQNVDWLIGMRGGNGQISQALSQMLLQMNKDGFKAKEALAMVGAKDLSQGMAGKVYTVDRPFLMWAVKGDLKYPLFATRVDYEFFREPNIR